MKHIKMELAALVLVLAAVLPLLDRGDARAEAKIQIPDTTEKIWQAIDADALALKQIIDTGALAQVHHEAYAIRDLVAALPAHSANLPDDRKAKVQADVKFVATLAERLDAAGDSNDKAGSESNYRKLAHVLADLRAIYGS